MKNLPQLIGWSLCAALMALTRTASGQDDTTPAPASIAQVFEWSPTQSFKIPEGAKLVAEENSTGRLVPGGRQPDGKFSYDLKIENTNDRPLTVQLLKILKPGISNLVYALNGSIKYNAVQGDAYLEMWSFFPSVPSGLPDRQYFSRTLGEAGAMQKITGTSDWRDFSLPFDRTGTTTPPTRLQVNLVLPGHGTVYFRPVSLDGYNPATSSSSTAPAGWWSATAAPWIGGIGGPVIGCFGGLLGALAGRGIARRLVLAIWRGLIVAGVVSLIAAVVGLLSGQPDFVTTPLLIFGVILTTVMGTIWPSAKKRYDELEIRRIASMDAMRG